MGNSAILSSYYHDKRHFSNRQTVLSSSVDSNGYPNYITSGSGLSANLSASNNNPLVLSFANGYDSYGSVDYIYNITSNKTISNLQSNNTNYLYADRDSSGNITFGSTCCSPDYSNNFNKTKYSLLHLNGSNGSTTITDEYNNTWAAAGNAQLQTANKKFGTASLLLDGTGDYIENTTVINYSGLFTVELWFYTADKTISFQTIFSNFNASNYGLTVQLQGSTQKLLYYISTNGTSFNIANGALGSKASWNNNQWYKFVVEYDGANFKAYVDGVLDYSVASSSKLCPVTKTKIGVYGTGSTSSLNGGIDEVRITLNNNYRYGGTHTQESSELSADSHWFDLNTFKMKYGSPSNWIEKQRVFLGEATTGASTVSSVVNYALNGVYNSGWFNVSNNTLYTKNHNLGVSSDQYTMFTIFRKNYTYTPCHIHHLYSSTTSLGGSLGLSTHNTYKIQTGGSYVNTAHAVLLGATDTDVTSGEYCTNITRNW